MYVHGLQQWSEGAILYSSDVIDPITQVEKEKEWKGKLLSGAPTLARADPGKNTREGYSNVLLREGGTISQGRY